MSESSSPLGRHADTVAAVVTISVVFAFLTVHVGTVLASLFGADVAHVPDSAQLDTIATAIVGYVFGAIMRAPSSTPAPTPATAP